MRLRLRGHSAPSLSLQESLPSVPCSSDMTRESSPAHCPICICLAAPEALPSTNSKKVWSGHFWQSVPHWERSSVAAYPIATGAATISSFWRESSFSERWGAPLPQMSQFSTFPVSSWGLQSVALRQPFPYTSQSLPQLAFGVHWLHSTNS